MLSPSEVDRLAANLAKIQLSPAQYFAVAFAVADALLYSDTPPGAPEVSAANGAAGPSKPKPKPRKAPGRPRGYRPGEALARAARVLEANPDMNAAALARAAGVSYPTAKRAAAARRKGTETPAAEHAAEPSPPGEPGRLAAVSLLRGVLSRGPKPASHVEELANKKGIGSKQLEAAKELMGVKVARFDNGQGVCYALPSHETEAAQAG